MWWLTCAGHSYYVARFTDQVIHDGHDTELIPRLLGAGEQREEQETGFSQAAVVVVGGLL